MKNETDTDLVGQALLLSFAGSYLTDTIRDQIARVRPAGVILFTDNCESPMAIHELCAGLQEHARHHGLPALLIGIDQEGGIVTRLPHPLITPPSQMAQGLSQQPDVARGCAELTGRQLRTLGINLNFAPVLDIHTNPDNPVIATRSFGTTPELVTQMGLAALAGYRNAGVIATIKHFPGHGDTTIDSHHGLPSLHSSRERLLTTEIAPFAAAINAGAPAVMSAHMLFYAFDDQPATLSRPILTEFLRGQLGFLGPIFTDALNMRAIADQYGPGQAAILARAAGADLVLPLGSLENQTQVAHMLVDALNTGQLHATDFHQTHQRLATLRNEYCLDTTTAFALPTAEDWAFVHDVAQRSIKVVNPQTSLPLPSTIRLLVVDCLVPRFAQIEEAQRQSNDFFAHVTQRFPHATGITLNHPIQLTDLEQVCSQASTNEAILLITRNASQIDAQTTLARQIAQLGLPLLIACVRNPDSQKLDITNATYIETCGDPFVSLQALLDVVSNTH
jgi:beta-N-acetylhexosaminidase